MNNSLIENKNRVQDSLVALVQHCQRHNKPWPHQMNIARAIDVSCSSLSGHLTALVKSGRIHRHERGVYSVSTLPVLEVQ